ncbi:MAG: hypothetical protein ACE5NM_10530 [Sedimentisphaerales bacterium]
MYISLANEAIDVRDILCFAVPISKDGSRLGRRQMQIGDTWSVLLHHEL